MARPHYIICSESRIVDKTTGLVTYYNVLEQLIAGASKPPQHAAAAPYLKFVVSAAWMRDEDDDDNTVYEFETRMHLPEEPQPVVVQSGEFQFGVHRFHRIELSFFGSLEKLPWPGEGSLSLRSGTLRLESRVRMEGDNKWVLQEYCVPIQVELRSSQLAESGQNSSEE